MSEGAGHSPSETQQRWQSWEQSWGHSRSSPWAHLLTQASIGEEGPLWQEHHSPRAKAGQHLDAPCTETHSLQAYSASQQLPTPCAVLHHEVANKPQKRWICNTGQSNESQSTVRHTETDGWLQRISVTLSPSKGGSGLTTPHCHLPNSGQPWLSKSRLQQAAVLTARALPESPKDPQQRCLPRASVPHNHHTVSLRDPEAQVLDEQLARGWD